MGKSNSKGKTSKHPRLGKIPEGWEVYSFSDVFEFLPRNSFSRDQMSYNGVKESVYNIHYGDIHATFNEQILDFSKHLHQIPVLIDNGVKFTEEAFLKDGDLIIADASEDYDGVGECIELTGINKRKVVAGLHTLAGRDKLGKTIQGFRAYILKHQRVFIELKKLATGSKVYGLSKTNISNLEIVIPPVPEQQKIARILSTWDKAIEKTEQLIAQKQQLKKGLMQQLLTGKVRFKEFVKSNKMKKTKLGLVPMDWEVMRVSDVTEIRGRVGWKGYTQEDLRDSGPFTLGAKHIDDNNKLDLTDPTFLSEEKFDESPEIKVQLNDILFVQRGSLGKVAIIDKEIGDATINPSMVIIRPHKKVSPKYLYQALVSEHTQKILKTEASSTGVPMISQAQIGGFRILLPSDREQSKIVQFMESLEQTITLGMQQLVDLQNQKKGLMQKLLMGEVRVKTK